MNTRVDEHGRAFGGLDNTTRMCMEMNLRCARVS